jgi:hypothetical protein
LRVVRGVRAVVMRLEKIVSLGERQQPKFQLDG